MKRILGDRGSGKMRKALLEAKKNDAVLITNNKSYTEELAKTIDCEDVTICGISEFFSRLGKKESEKYFIDELDIFLDRLVEAKFSEIIGYTITELPKQPAEKGVKPPLGLRPRWAVEESRMYEIMEAMKRYSADSKPVPENWLNELDDLIRARMSMPLLTE